jgi:predicted transcriptional regulator
VKVGERLFLEDAGRRDRLQILSDIVTVCTKPSRLTKVLRLANAQYRFVSDALGKLVDAGLLEIVQAERGGKRAVRMFLTTDRGLRWRDLVVYVYEVVDGGGIPN